MTGKRSAQGQAPVLFLVFNRPATTRRVFGAIRDAKPSKLFVAADGPRLNRPADQGNCREARRIATQVDWDCDVRLLLRDENVGCRRAVAEAIAWFFESVESGIVLEDDCLPDGSFFCYCAELLDLYAHDNRVMMISGNSFLDGSVNIQGSYYFSRYPHIWGWATWRRAWRLYDPDMVTFPLFEQQRQIENLIESPGERKHWIRVFRSAHAREIDTWDYQWVYAIFANSGLCISPAVNLVSNIGFEAGATHTKDPGSPLANMKVGSIDGITHPPFVLRNARADEHRSSHVGVPKRSNPWRRRLSRLIRRVARRKAGS